MISVTTGDILKSQKHALVNTVNCVGVMGKGVALAFKRNYPAMFEDYVARCQRAEVRLGHPYPYEASDGHVIINFPTKDHWRAVSRLSDIVEGIDFIREHYREWGVRSIAVPPLGCGNGQLEWNVVGPTLYRELSKLDIEVELFAPIGTPPDEMQLDFFSEIAPPAISTYIEPAWVALIETIRRIEASTNYWPVGRTRFQKLAYFLASEGLPMGLEYERGQYGPFSSQLKGVVSKLVNNGILVEVQRGRMSSMEVGSTFDDARKAFETELKSWNHEINQVADLFVRMNTNQSEIAATIHFVAKELHEQLGKAPSDRQIIDEVLDWKPLRGNFTREIVSTAIESLAVLEWIQIEPSSDLFTKESDLASIA